MAAAAAPDAAAVAVQAVVQAAVLAAVQTDHWIENNSLVLACVLPSIREGTFSYILAIYTHSVWMSLKGLRGVEACSWSCAGAPQASSQPHPLPLPLPLAAP